MWVNDDDEEDINDNVDDEEDVDDNSDGGGDEDDDVNNDAVIMFHVW